VQGSPVIYTTDVLSLLIDLSSGQWSADSLQLLTEWSRGQTLRSLIM